MSRKNYEKKNSGSNGLREQRKKNFSSFYSAVFPSNSQFNFINERKFIQINSKNFENIRQTDNILNFLTHVNLFPFSLNKKQDVVLQIIFIMYILFESLWNTIRWLLILKFFRANSFTNLYFIIYFIIYHYMYLFIYLLFILFIFFWNIIHMHSYGKVSLVSVKKCSKSKKLKKGKCDIYLGKYLGKYDIYSGKYLGKYDIYSGKYDIYSGKYIYLGKYDIYSGKYDIY